MSEFFQEYTFEEWEVCLQKYSKYRSVDTDTHYNSVPKETRALFKEHIAFLYTLYKEEQFFTVQNESLISSLILRKKYTPIEYFSLFLPSILSIPILLSLLIPAQILKIPSQLFFIKDTKTPSTLHVALELLGINEIYFLSKKDYDILFTITKDNPLAKNITSGNLFSKNSILHYTTPNIYTSSISEHYPILYPDANFDTMCTKKYYDACFGNCENNALSNQHLKEGKEHLWFFTQLKLLQYYTIQSFIA